MKLSVENSTNEKLLAMTRIRMVEEAIAERYSEGKMRCPTHLSIGQEAVAVGVCSQLTPADYAMSTHRAHAHYLAKGGDLNRLIAEIYGKKTGCSGGLGGSMHLIDRDIGFMGSTAIVGNTIPVAVGMGLAIQNLNEDRISCVFFGDGSTEEGAFYEAASFAALRSLPVLFICENNFFSVYSPLSVRQPCDRNICTLAGAIGLNVHRGFGNDVEEVASIVGSAIGEIKSGNGPQLIEFETYRWREHCGPNYDDDLNYRDRDITAKWLEKDPLVVSKKVGCAIDEKAIKAFEGEIANAFEFAELSEFPKFTDLPGAVFA